MRIGGTEFGSTPLHEAAMMGHIDIFELLLESGAEVDVHRTQHLCTEHVRPAG